MTFVQQAALAADDTFRSRVRVALAVAASQIMGEDPAPYSDDQYGLRQSLALQVLHSAAGGTLLEAFVWAVVANPAISDVSTDSDIQFTVNSAWDDMAGFRGDN
ncbi:hypothetical protein [Actinomadura nitritigenes]|uniref:hypothetical protein n=1 Tax=Actinomadura nitritigenes TaxID=134602 RepID=UPI003D8BA93E